MTSRRGRRATVVTEAAGTIAPPGQRWHRLASPRTLMAIALLGGLAARLYDLVRLPIFVDEGIYLHFAQLVAAAPARQAFLPVIQDGKPPLFVWLVAAGLKALPEHPLLVGRGISALCGVLTAWALYRGSRRLFTAGPAVLACLLYLASPLALSHDRLALTDSLLTLAGTAALFLGLELVREPRLWLGLPFGLALGAGLLTKNTGILFMLLAPALLWLRPPLQLPRRALVHLVAGWSLAYGVAVALYAPVLLSPWYADLDQTVEREYTFSLAQLAALPLAIWDRNLGRVEHWAVAYLGWPLIVALALALLTLLWRPTRARLLLALWALAPIALTAVLAKSHFYPRYLLPFFPPLLVLAAAAAWGVAGAAPRLLGSWARSPVPRACLSVGLAAVLLWPNLSFARTVLFNPGQAPFPPVDRWQFVDGWPSGNGLDDILAYLDQVAARGPLVIYIDEPGVSVNEDTLMAFLGRWGDRVVFRHRGEIPTRVPPSPPSFFVCIRPPAANLAKRLQPALASATPDGLTSWRLYRLDPTPDSSPVSAVYPETRD